MEKFEWLKPYTTRRIRGWWWWFNGFYQVLFDNTVILVFEHKEEAERICAALNGAYNISRSDLKFEQEFSQQKKRSTS